MKNLFEQLNISQKEIIFNNCTKEPIQTAELISDLKNKKSFLNLTFISIILLCNIFSIELNPQNIASLFNDQ